MATYRVLALDGGGIRGLVTATILRRVCDVVPGFLDDVDLFAGTSSGGLIALSLAHGLGKKTKVETLDEIIRVFDAAHETFGPALPRPLGTWWFAKYRSAARAEKLRTLFDGARLADLAHRVLIASFDLDNNEKESHKRPRRWEPKLFHNYAGDNSDNDALAWEVAMATSAAPVLFPAFRGLIDGGVYSNNPSMCAVAQLLDRRYRPMSDPERGARNPRLDEIVLLSVGSGLSLTYLPARGTGPGWGALPWSLPGIGNIVKLVTDGTVGIADYQCRQLLREGYRRIDTIFDPGVNIGLDSIKDLPRLREAAGRWRPTQDDITFFSTQWSKKTGVAMPSNTTPVAEPTTAEKIAQAFIAKVKQRMATEPDLDKTPRGAHPRHHGLVNAQFVIADSVPADLRHGLFELPGHPYSAMVRFSNAGADKRDAAPDARGIAIKVFGVTGPHLSPDSQGAGAVQDFLLTNFPAFIASSPAHFLKFMVDRRAIALAEAAGSPQLPALVQQLHRDFPNLAPAQTNIHNPLMVRYFSQTPYAMGAPGVAVKYSARPTELETERPLSEEEKANPTYLRSAMAKRLESHSEGRPVVFEFQIQRQGEGMEIEDPTKTWDEQQSPFVTVATLEIPLQQFQSDDQMKLAEAISFNPWNSLTAHQPLGEVNLARRTVYAESQSFRAALRANPTPRGV